MKALHPITCAGSVALLFLGSACQAPSGAAMDDPNLIQADSQGASAPLEPAMVASQETAPKARPAAKPKGKAKGKAAPKEPTVESLTEELDAAKEAKVDAERELRYAEADLEIAEMGAAGAEIDAEESLRSARAELEAAQVAREMFVTQERPLKEEKAGLAVSDAEERLVTAQTDLIGLEEIFAEEAEASAKPEILRRGRRKVERAQRSLEMARAEARMTLSSELPARLKELSGKVRAKESALRSAEVSAAKGRRSAELGVEKATDSADAKKRDVRKAAEKVKSLEKRLNDARQKKQGGKGKPASGKDADKNQK